MIDSSMADVVKFDVLGDIGTVATLVFSVLMLLFALYQIRRVLTRGGEEPRVIYYPYQGKGPDDPF